MNIPSRFVSYTRLPAVVVWAALVLLLAPLASADDVQVTVLDRTPGSTVIRYDIPSFSRDVISIEGTDYLAISLDGEARYLEAGKPSLPRVSRSVIVPPAAAMAVNVIDSTWYEIDGHAVPSKGNLLRSVDPASVPYTFGGIYDADTWFPAAQAELSDPYIMRDTRGCVVSINPFSYNPALGKIKVFTSLTVEVKEVGPATRNVLDASIRRPSRPFQQLCRTHFINFPNTRYTPLDEDGDLLIIVYDSWNSNVQALKTWKDSIGISTTVVNVSTIGNNSSSIKSYIQNLYNSSNLAFVLLVGDSGQVATYYTGGSASDPSYSLMTGDNYPDLMVGRFSATNSGHVDTQVERTIEFERGDHMNDSWFMKGTGIASTEGPGHNGEYDHIHMGYIRNDLLSFGYTAVDEFYGYGASSSQVSNAVNSGRGIINYCGHGSTTSWGTTGFSNSHVNSLVNDNMLPFITSVACLNGNFTSGTCFAEAWLQATHNGEPSGAIAMYASTISQSWSPPMEAQDEYIDRYCDLTYDHYGTLCFAGSCKMMDRYGNNGVSEFKYWTVFGDPSLSLREGGGSGGDVVPDIKVNGSDGPLVLQAGTTVNVTVSLDPGDQAGLNCEWWLWAEYNWSTIYSWQPPHRWFPSANPVLSYTSGLFDLNSYVAGSSVIPSGFWDFHFVIDDQINGSLDETWSDMVEVQIN